VRLIAASDAVGDGDSISLGLQFRLNEGWEIYWRSPGDAGYPPRVDWSGSANLAQAELRWPLPVRFTVLGFETVGYKHEVVLPIVARPIRAGKAVEIRASVDYLTCSDICVPQSADLTLDLPSGPARPSVFAHLISRYLNRVPGDGKAHGLDLGPVHVVGSGSGTRLRVEATSIEPFSDPDVFIEGPEELAFDAPRVVLDRGDRHAVLDVGVIGAEFLEKPLAGTPITVTLVDGDRAAERRLSVDAMDSGAGAATPTAETSLAVILALGLLGGLILNLMPCVLPVLSIKLLGVVGHGGGRPRTVRLSFIASAAGILFSFMILAGALAALKASGAAVGWGLQFQHPWFLTAMTLVVVLFACNLWGFFEIRLPGAIADAGEHASHVHGLGGHFLTGALATVLATPCSAPFLGTAVGFALSRGTGEIFAVFAALGVGLAAPYLAVAAVPKLATMLPRPGPWMIVMRRVLALALAGTGIWLLTVLAAQRGEAGAAAVGVLAAAMAAALYAGGRVGPRFGRFGGIAAATLAALAFFVPSRASDTAGAVAEGVWVPFDAAAIPELVADGRTVFVNVTADWCITCRVNESLVLARSPVRERLSSAGIVSMKGDWTLPDPAISDYLARFGRYGIPFDAVYGPGLPEGEALPELLSRETVLSALDRASGAEK
jgi:suppressor for copper-sensitivity B